MAFPPSDHYSFAQLQADLTQAKKLAQQDPRYPHPAFLYLIQTLREMLDNRKEGEHVTGKEVCLALRQNLLDEFSLLAPDVLRTWNIVETNDIGNMVYDMVDAGLFSTSPQDSRADFVDVYPIPGALNMVQEGRAPKWPVLEP
ncbi:MAG: Minf_1886 family protein [Oligosphaeraceae bacterium]